MYLLNLDISVKNAKKCYLNYKTLGMYSKMLSGVIKHSYHGGLCRVLNARPYRTLILNLHESKRVPQSE